MHISQIKAGDRMTEKMERTNILEFPQQDPLKVAHGQMMNKAQQLLDDSEFLIQKYEIILGHVSGDIETDT